MKAEDDSGRQGAAAWRMMAAGMRGMGRPPSLLDGLRTTR